MSEEDFNKYSKSYGIPSYPFVMKGFGSINELREKAGLKKKPTEKTKYNFTEEELVQIYLDFSRNLWK